MKIAYFTATGNSLYVAKELADTFRAELYSIPQLLKQDRIVLEDDVIGFVFPVYAYATPHIVREFIYKVRLTSNYTFAVMSYGGMTGDSGNWFKKYAAAHGITIDYTKAILMVDNYLPRYDVAAQVAMDKDIPGQIARAISDITAHKHEIQRGSRFVTYATQLFINSILRECRHFTVNESCNACGICVKVCPRGNVKVDKKPAFGKNCESCLACIQSCPPEAIHIKGEKNPDARFRNEHITLNEIIAANSQ